MRPEYTIKEMPPYSGSRPHIVSLECMGPHYTGIGHLNESQASSPIPSSHFGSHLEEPFRHLDGRVTLAAAGSVFALRNYVTQSLGCVIWSRSCVIGTHGNVCRRGGAQVFPLAIAAGSPVSASRGHFHGLSRAQNVLAGRRC